MTQDAGDQEAIIEAMLAMVLAQHGQRLSAEQTEEVRTAVRELVEAGERLARFPLENSDEPAFRFAPEEV